MGRKFYTWRSPPTPSRSATSAKYFGISLPTSPHVLGSCVVAILVVLAFLKPTLLGRPAGRMCLHSYDDVADPSGRIKHLMTCTADLTRCEIYPPDKAFGVCKREVYDPGCRLERINASTAQNISVDHLDYLSNSIDCAAELIAVFSEAKRAKEKNSSSIYRLHHNLPISPECKRNCQHDIHFDFNDATNKLLTPPHHVKEWHVDWQSPQQMAKLYVKELLQSVKTGVSRSQIVQAMRQCQNPLLLKVVKGKLYVHTDANNASRLKHLSRRDQNFSNNKRKQHLGIGYDDLQQRILKTRLRQLEVLAEAVDNAYQEDGMRDTELVLCSEDAAWNSSQIMFNSISGPPGVATTLPLGPYINYSPAGRLWQVTTPWCNRLQLAYFRGSLGSCYQLHSDEMGHPPLSKTSAYELNVSSRACSRAEILLQMHQCGNGMIDAMITPDNHMIDQTELEKYKLVIHAAHHNGWAEDLCKLLLSGATVVRQQNQGGREWFERHLKPWVHYIPVDHLFRNLADVLAWAAVNDDSVKQISINANRFADYFFTRSTQSLFSKTLIKQYANLTKFTVRLTSNDHLVAPGISSLVGHLMNIDWSLVDRG